MFTHDCVDHFCICFRILCAFRGKYLSQEIFRAEQDQTENGSVYSGEDSDFEESSAGGTVLYSDLTEGAKEEEAGKTVWVNTLSQQDECEAVVQAANGAETVDQAEEVAADKLLACTGVSGEVDGAEASSGFSPVGYGTEDYVSVDDITLRTQEVVVHLDGEFFSPESLAYNVGRCFIEVWCSKLLTLNLLSISDLGSISQEVNRYISVIDSYLILDVL